MEHCPINPKHLRHRPYGFTADRFAVEDSAKGKGMDVGSLCYLEVTQSQSFYSEP